MKVLVANRGEIALRIIRACEELGIPTVAIYSTADKDSLPVLLADEAYCIGPGPAKDSYLNIPAVLTAALLSKATAIHPGFGFLAENQEFAEACQACGLLFIGPKSTTIGEMGDKIAARKKMQALKVPVIPGSDGKVRDVTEALSLGEKIGYPLMIKAASGGGGKGMRAVTTPEMLKTAFQAAEKEALAAFGDDSLYIEKIITNAKHIEVQILGDGKGKVLHFGERDCSMQRQHQKVLEEAPATGLKASTREKIIEYAVTAAKGVNYLSLGTLEFLVDEQENIYFMEMNTRIQVEHPITEMITQEDLVKHQLQLAISGELSLSQAEIQFSGVALECRLNAEDPKNHFFPNAGKITDLYLPQGTLGLRVDSGIYEGYTLPSFYDSMLAKIIVHAPTREEAIMKMQRALNELEISGIKTNQEFQLDLITHPSFLDNHYRTNFVEEEFLPQWLGEK